MRNATRIALIVAVAFAAPNALAADAPAVAQPGRGAAAARGTTGYWASATCGGCHPRTLDQQLQSHHERSFTNPIFQAQYFESILPRASRDPELSGEARSCTACHAPVAFANAWGTATRAMLTDPSMSGVTCDLCHTIRGVDGPEPVNGNFLSTPSDVKFGPLKGSDNAHHAYSEIQSKSELCGTCHEATNHRGVRVKTTYSEWLASPSAKAGAQCQDCHMTRDGLIRAAAVGSEGFVRYTHRFPGAHSGAQVEGAVQLGIAPGAAASKGRRTSFRISVDNSRSGHRLPTGSTDLRVLWLEVVARSGDRTIPVPVNGSGEGVAGAAGEDARILGKDVPAGSRIYRAIFLDAKGKQTLESWDAVKIGFDNRLPAGGKVTEEFVLDVPKDVTGPLAIEARLRYLAYPSSFAALMDLSAPPPVDVAKATATLPALP